MRPAEVRPDDVVGLVAVALAQARGAAPGLHHTILPALPPDRRAVPRRLARQLERGELFDATVLQEIEALLAALDGMIAAGTHAEWHGDANHARGGYEVTRREAGTAKLASAAGDLKALRSAIADAMDAARAHRRAGEMLGM